MSFIQMRFKPFYILIFAFLLMPSALAANHVFWKGTSAGYQVEWSSADLKAVDSKSNRTVFSARETAQANFEHVKKKLQPNEVYEEDYELLSLVGPIMSVEYHAKISSGLSTKNSKIHQKGITRYVAVDLQNPSPAISRMTENRDEFADPANHVKLSDIFTEKDLLAAFNNDTVIQSTIDTATITTLSDLVKTLKGKSLPAPDMCGKFDSCLLNEFGFHHLRGKNAVVRLGISGVEPKPETLSELGMVVPIAEPWLSKFNLAADGKEGILMGALKKKTGSARTHFEFKMHAQNGSAN